MDIINGEEVESGVAPGSIETQPARDRLIGQFSDWMTGPDFAVPYSDQTIRAYARHAKAFLRICADSHLIEVSEANAASIRSFMTETVSDASPSTRAQAVSAIDAFFDFCEIEALCEENPVKAFRARQKRGRRGGRAAKRLPSFLYPNEVDDLMDVLFRHNHVTRERNLALVGFLLDSGIRTSELTRMTLDDVAGLESQGVFRVIGKNDKERIVRPLDNHRHWLIAFRDARRADGAERDDLIFITRGRGQRPHGRLSQSTVHHIVSSAIHKAGISGKNQWGGHLLRHTAATLMLASGMSLRRVQENLGHANLNNTQIYTHLIDVSPEASRQTTEEGK